MFLKLNNLPFSIPSLCLVHDPCWNWSSCRSVIRSLMAWAKMSLAAFFFYQTLGILHLQLKARALSSCLMVVLWLELGCWHPKGRKMNAHAHLTGQISSQMSTQSSTQVSGPSQQIGNFMASQMQGLGSGPMDSELQNGRATMQQKMWVFTLQLNYYVLSSLCQLWPCILSHGHPIVLVAQGDGWSLD